MNPPIRGRRQRSRKATGELQMASVHALPGPRIARRPTSISTTDRMRRSACLSAALRTKVQRRQCRLPDRVTVVGRGRRRRMWIRIVVVTVVGRGRRRRMWIPIVVVFVMMRGRRVRSRCIPGRCRPHRMWFRIVVVTVGNAGVARLWRTEPSAQGPDAGQSVIGIESRW